MKTLIALMVALPWFVSPSVAAEDMTAARKILAEKQDAVLWFSCVAKVSFAAPESSGTPVNVPDEEIKMTGYATVVDTNGLAVTVLSHLDPARGMNGRSLRTSKGPLKVDATSVLKDLKVILPDSTEIPAELVLKDADLDLGIIRIKLDSKEAKDVKLQAIDLKDSASGEMLDQVVTISRADELFNRVPSVLPGHVIMVTKRPRAFLRATGNTGGCPTFKLDGKLIGITAGRLVKGRQPTMALIPAADILELAEQAVHAKPIPQIESKPAGPSAKEPVDLDQP